MEEKREQRTSDIIAGRNAVNEALRSGRTIDSLYVVRGNHSGALAAMIAKAKACLLYTSRDYRTFLEGKLAGPERAHK